ncbi:MAG: alternative ribosome rescue aminoacyl-tRNA hydrolase ArfB [Actinomycetota bacterium]
MSPRIDVDSDIKTQRGLIVPVSSLIWAFSRSSGAGGQHVNKTSSRATLTVTTADVSGPQELVERVRSALGPTIVVVSQDSRSQWQNRQTCRARLVMLLDDAAAPPAPPRRKTKPSKGSVERRLTGKKLTAAKKAGRRGEGW